MPVISRASLPEEFFDITSAMLLIQPEPQYMYAQMWKSALGAALPARAVDKAADDARGPHDPPVDEQIERRRAADHEAPDEAPDPILFDHLEFTMLLFDIFTQPECPAPPSACLRGRSPAP